MKTQFTPGPWKVGVNKNTGMPATEVWARSEALCVASGFGDGPESEANAKLIASAPELLAALEDVLNCDGDLKSMDFDGYRAAVAKARGGGK